MVEAMVWGDLGLMFEFERQIGQRESITHLNFLIKYVPIAFNLHNSCMVNQKNKKANPNATFGSRKKNHDSSLHFLSDSWLRS